MRYRIEPPACDLPWWCIQDTQPEYPVDIAKLALGFPDVERVATFLCQMLNAYDGLPSEVKSG